jgi:hypothetical protein
MTTTRSALDICEICGTTFATNDDHLNTSGIAICQPCLAHEAPTCPCGAPIPEEGDYCPDCAQASVPEEVKAMKPYRALIAAAALALALTTHTASAQRFTDYPIIGTAAYDASCTITHEWEDHSAIAYCTEDGATYAFDADGNGMAGISYNPGWQWHAIEERP